MLGLCLLLGCVEVPAGAPAVPPLPPERIPAPPASTVTLIWQPGHYDWTGSEYAYVPGVWVSRAEHGPLWQDGSWRRAGTGWEWVPARWL